MSDEFRFRWVASYLGCVDYEVYGDGPAYRVEVRREASDYERSIYNGDDAAWQRDVVSAIGLMRRSHDIERPIADGVVDAFNAWRAAEHADRVRRLRSEPERYGMIADDDPLLAPPAIVRGAHYEFGKGWIVERDSQGEAPILDTELSR